MFVGKHRKKNISGLFSVRPKSRQKYLFYWPKVLVKFIILPIKYIFYYWIYIAQKFLIFVLYAIIHFNKYILTQINLRVYYFLTKLFTLQCRYLCKKYYAIK